MQTEIATKILCASIARGVCVDEPEPGDKRNKMERMVDGSADAAARLIERCNPMLKAAPWEDTFKGDVTAGIITWVDQGGGMFDGCYPEGGPLYRIDNSGKDSCDALAYYGAELISRSLSTTHAKYRCLDHWKVCRAEDEDGIVWIVIPGGDYEGRVGGELRYTTRHRPVFGYNAYYFSKKLGVLDTMEKAKQACNEHYTAAQHD